METSSTRKIYVDSRRKTPSSESSSDFFFELNRSVTLPRKCVAFVTDIHLPHSWYNVDTHAQFLYIQEHSDVVYSGQVPPQLFREGVRRVQIPAGHYTGTDLATALQQQLRTSTVHAGLNTYNVAYSSITGKIEISLTNDLDSANVLPLTHIVSLGAPTGSHWKIYNAEVENSPEFLTRTGALTYTYTAQNQPHTMTISEIDYANRTFKAVTSAGSTYRWNNTLERLENVANNWNWRPQFTLSFNLLNNYFSVLTDHQLSQPSIASQFTVAGIPLNRLSPSSINHLLRHDGRRAGLDQLQLARGLDGQDGLHVCVQRREAGAAAVLLAAARPGQQQHTVPRPRRNSHRPPRRADGDARCAHTRAR